MSKKRLKWNNVRYVLHAWKRKPLLILRTVKFSLRRLLGQNVIRGIDIVVTYACNLRCAHCNVASQHAPERQELQEDEIVNLIRQAQEIGAFYITFTGGEPLLKIDMIERIINKIGKGSMLWMIQTNGTLLNDDICRRLRAMGVDNLQLSFDTYHEADNWQDVIKLTEEQILMAKRWGMAVNLTWLASHETLASEETLNELSTFSKKHKTNINLNLAVPQGRWTSQEGILLTPEDSIKVRELTKEHKYLFLDMDTSLINFGCPAFSERFHINAYGDVQPCTFFQIRMGNIREEPLKVIWQRGLRFPIFADFPECCPPAEDPKFMKLWFEKSETVESLPISCTEFFDQSQGESS